MAHGRQSEHHAGVLAESIRGASRGHTVVLAEGTQGCGNGHAEVLAEGPQSELHSMHHDLFQKEGPLFSLPTGASPSCVFPEGWPFLFPKRISMVTVGKVPFLRVPAIIL